MLEISSGGLIKMIDVAVAVSAAAQAYSMPPTFVGSGMDQEIHVLRIEMSKTTILAPRGTTDVRAALLDLMVRKVPVTGHPEMGLVHSGFLEAAQSVAPQIAEADDPNKDLV